MSDQNLYLTDEQYLELLHKIKDVVNKSDFKPYWYNSDAIGDKYTETNCGLCNDNFTTNEMSAFPSRFPTRKEMKYRKNIHKCPFDFRPRVGWNGCYYTCWFFKRGLRDIGKIKQLVEEQLQKGINNEVYNGNEEIEEPQCPEFFKYKDRLSKTDLLWNKKGCYAWLYDKCTLTVCYWKMIDEKTLNQNK